MAYERYSNRIGDNQVALSGLVVTAVFFLVSSQVLILPLPSIATQVFRPLIVLACMFRMRDTGGVNSWASTFAIIAAIHALASLVFHTELWSSKVFFSGIAVVLYFLMFAFAISVKWSGHELKFMLFFSFFACFICAVALLTSNDPTDFQAATVGHLKLLGYEVNRNKNAYQFSFGVVLGLIYLFKGKRIPKLLFAGMTAVMVYALLYSQCRGAFLCCVAGSTVVILGMLLDLRKRSGSTAFTLLVLTVLAYIAAYMLLKNSELSRLINTDNTSGRDEGIVEALNIFRNSDFFSRLFGSGFGYESTQIEGIGAHMVFVSFLVSIGILGMLLTLGMFTSAFRRCFGAGAYGLFLCAFLKAFFESADYNIYIPMILAVLICDYARRTGRSHYELFSRK